MQSPCTSICSLLDASLTTEAPHANFLPNFFAASASFTPNNSSPCTDVMHLRLFLVARSTTTWRRQGECEPPPASPLRRACGFFAAFFPLGFATTALAGSPACSAPPAASEAVPGA